MKRVQSLLTLRFEPVFCFLAHSFGSANARLTFLVCLASQHPAPLPLPLTHSRKIERSHMNSSHAPHRAVSSSEVSAYGLAAAAAVAVGVPFDQAAEAEVLNSGPQNIDIAQFGAGFVDLDFDAPISGTTYGLGDIFVGNYVFAGGNYQFMSKAIGDVGNWMGYIAPNGFGYASAVSAGSSIGPATVGPSIFGNLGFEATPYGDFLGAPAAEQFVGLAFQSESFGGSTHYAWIRVLASVPDGELTLIDWAFESTPDTPILAGDTGSGTLIADVVPEPGSLGLLAAGAVGLMSYRGRKRAS